MLLVLLAAALSSLDFVLLVAASSVGRDILIIWSSPGFVDT